MAWGSWGLMIVIFVSIIATVITLTWHILAPWDWLDPEELSTLKNFVLSGAIVGLGTSYLRKYLDY